MKEDPSCIATTMVDFHGLPARGSGAWPGRAAASGSSREKERHVEDAVMEDVVHSLQGRYNPSRFVPFVVMHEFEALLFSDCAALSRGIGRPQLEGDFMKVRLQFDSPEDINDDPDTAPSKRVSAIARGYEKPLLGALAILEIGLDRIRAECAHFDGWITRLETIVSEH